MGKKVLILLLVLAAGLGVGALISGEFRGRLSAEGGAGEAEAIRGLNSKIEALLAKQAQLEARVGELEARPALVLTKPGLAAKTEPAHGKIEKIETGRTDSPSAGIREDELVAALSQEGSAVEDAVQAMMERLARRRDAKAVAKKNEAVAAWVEGEIDRWGKQYELSSGQVNSLKELTKKALEAQGEEMEPWARTQLEVKTQGEVRRIVGDRVYRATEQERMLNEARKSVSWVAYSVGGMTDEQHAQLDRLVHERVEGKLDDTVRVRSEDLGQANHEAMMQRMRDYDLESWRQIREGILTETQRARLPTK